jgi:stearoyl-CoA desaturase (delta-9 desaturase)
MAQQVPLALVLLALGGWGWVVWGVPVRIAVSLVGHWMVGHFAHRRGQQGWVVDGLPVQGFNLPRLGWLTFGENWHGNHHAFPHSARLGLEPGQRDPGFWLVQGMERAGLAWDVREPGALAPRTGLRRVAAQRSRRR